MLHKALVDYLENVEQTLMALEDAYVERYVEEILTPQRVTLRIRVRFAAGHHQPGRRQKGRNHEY